MTTSKLELTEADVVAKRRKELKAQRQYVQKRRSTAARYFALTFAHEPSPTFFFFRFGIVNIRSTAAGGLIAENCGVETEYFF